MRWIALMSASLLAGCAATPLPELPSQDYFKYARLLQRAAVCEQRGAIDPQLLAYGYTRIRQSLAGYRYSESTLEQSQAQLKSMEVSEADCNYLATGFAGMKDEYERNSRESGGFTRYTNCYSGPIGTNCHTY